MASFKIMTSQTGQQIITIHILPNIPRIVINCRLTCDVINFENKYSFLIEVLSVVRNRLRPKGGRLI